MDGKKWLVGAVLLGMVFLGYGLYKSMPSGRTPGSSQTGSAVQVPVPSGSIEVSIASSNTKEEWLANMVAEFNNAAKANKDYQVSGKPIFVVVLKEKIDGKEKDYRSGTMVTDTLNEKIKPTILSPGEESWIDLFKKEWQVKFNSTVIRSQAPVLVRTPLVIAMWQSRAKALGCWPQAGPNCTWERIRQIAVNPEGWKSVGHPEWGRFTFGYGYFGESNSGTLGVISMCTVGAKKTKGLVPADVSVDGGCGKFIHGIEAAKIHSGKSDVWLLEKMVHGGPEYLNAVITYESNVISTNRKFEKELREPLVSVYPQDGTIVVGHPFAVLEGAPWVSSDQTEAAKVFGKYLMSAAAQEAVLALGLRPADKDTKIGSPIEASFGANPQARLVPLEIPSSDIIERVGEVWHHVKKPAVVVVVFDKSGSMGNDGKIGAAIKGAQEFINRMDGNDYLIWLPFDHVIYTNGVRGYRSKVGEELVGQIQGTIAKDGTALYDAVLAGMDILDSVRTKFGDKVRYGMVVLSDGKDENSSYGSFKRVEDRLKPKESDPMGVQIHTIAIGNYGEGKSILQKIANWANGKYWEGMNQKDMIKVYRDIASYY